MIEELQKQLTEAVAKAELDRKFRVLAEEQSVKQLKHISMLEDKLKELQEKNASNPRNERMVQALRLFADLKNWSSEKIVGKPENFVFTVWNYRTAIKDMRHPKDIAGEALSHEE